MAIVGTDEDENNPNGQPTSVSDPNSHPTAQGGGGSGFAGGTGAGSGQGATTGVAATPAPAKGGGGYTNLSQYLAANQGSGATTGQGAENVVNQDANAAQTAANQFNTGATNDIANATAGLGVNQKTEKTIAAGTPAFDPAEAALIKNGGYEYNPSKVWTQALNDPTNASKDTLNQIVAEGAKANSDYSGPSNFNTAQYNTAAGKYTPVSYGGPQSLTGFTGDTAAAQQNAVTNQGTLQGDVKNANGGQTGVSALLRSAYQQPNYSKGENSLDAFLVGGTPGGQQAIGQATGVGQQVMGGYQSLLGNLQNRITAGQNKATNTNATYDRDVLNAQNAAKNNINTYKTDMANAQARAVKDTGLAQAAAKKAQAELDARKSAYNDGVNHPVDEPPPPPPPPVGGELGKLVDYTKTAGGKASAWLKKEGGNIAGFAKDPRNTTIDAANIAEAQAANAAKNTESTLGNYGTNIYNAIPKPSLPTPSLPSIGGWYKGGQIPSYSKLSKMLRRK